MLYVYKTCPPYLQHYPTLRKPSLESNTNTSKIYTQHLWLAGAHSVLRTLSLSSSSAPYYSSAHICLTVSSRNSTYNASEQLGAMIKMNCEAVSTKHSTKHRQPQWLVGKPRFPRLRLAHSHPERRSCLCEYFEILAILLEEYRAPGRSDCRVHSHTSIEKLRTLRSIKMKLDK